jgi:hypothetical protein
MRIEWHGKMVHGKTCHFLVERATQKREAGSSEDPASLVVTAAPDGEL